MDTRLAAAQAVLQVLQEGQSLSRVLPRYQAQVDDRDRALLQELVYGVLRWQPRIDAYLGALLAKALKPKDRDIECLLRVGLYQLGWMRIKPYAAVDGTVKAVRSTGKSWASKLVNGVLRNFQRRQAELETQADAEPQSRWAHPGWLIERLEQDWPGDWQAILEANNGRAPMTLRVNARRQSRAAYLERLAAADIEARALPFSEQGVILAKPVDVNLLPGFAAGEVSVQDGGAQLAAVLLDVQPGMRVLDACAAPGGKTGHILERQPDLKELVALDIDTERLGRVQENLDRLQLDARLMEGDAAEPDSWWDGQGFDRILLDVPCSATGVIRRHPDIKQLRQAADIDDLVSRQSAMVDAVWPLLAPGGRLVYATCSVLAAENDNQVTAFLARQADARSLELDAAWGHARRAGRQLLPAMHADADMDGFYYACLSNA